jgi:hypothetical protein
LEKLRGDSLFDVVNRSSLYRANCLTQLLLFEDFARVVDNFPIPLFDANPPTMVMSSWSKDPNRWKIRNADGITVSASDYLIENPDLDINILPRHNDLPGPEIVRARIEAGWTPSNNVPIPAEATATSSNLIGSKIREPKTLYLAHFADRNSAKSFVDELSQGHSSDQMPEHQQDGLWSVEIEREGYLDQEFVDRILELCHQFDGLYDGDMDISD